MLRNTTSPETYFQTAFRIQSPWTIASDRKNNVEEKILKKECYLFDFAPNRALRLITDYCIRLNIDNDKKTTEEKIEEFIKFLPILCFNGSVMTKINSEEVLDYGMVGTSGTQLAKKFESSRLINVDNNTLKNILNDQKALDILMKIEGFRTIQSELEKIINKTEKINKIKKDIGDDISTKQKKELSQEEKDQRNLRKKIQDKIKIFATRIPVFMYLTDYREETLKDVITQLEPGLFKKLYLYLLKILNISPARVSLIIQKWTQQFLLLRDMKIPHFIIMVLLNLIQKRLVFSILKYHLKNFIKIKIVIDFFNKVFILIFINERI